MTKQERLILIRRAVSDSYMDAHDLVEMLELSVEDILQLLPSKLLEFEHKFLIPSSVEDISDEEREREEWAYAPDEDEAEE